MNGIVMSAWADLSGGCPVRCSVSGSNMAQLYLGSGDGAVELGFDVETMRVLVQEATAALAEMDALFQQEEEERVAAEREAAGRHRLVTP